MAGSTADEGTILTWVNVTSDDEFRALVAGWYPDKKDISRIEELYPNDPSLGS